MEPRPLPTPARLRTYALRLNVVATPRDDSRGPNRSLGRGDEDGERAGDGPRLPASPAVDGRPGRSGGLLCKRRAEAPTREVRPVERSLASGLVA